MANKTSSFALYIWEVTVFSFSQLWTLRWNLFPLAMSNNNNNNNNKTHTKGHFTHSALHTLNSLFIFFFYHYLSSYTWQRLPVESAWVSLFLVFHHIGKYISQDPYYTAVYCMLSTHSAQVSAVTPTNTKAWQHFVGPKFSPTAMWAQSHFFTCWQPMTKITMWNIKGKSIYAFPSWGLSSCMPSFSIIEKWLLGREKKIRGICLVRPMKQKS